MQKDLNVTKTTQVTNGQRHTLLTKVSIIIQVHSQNFNKANKKKIVLLWPVFSANLFLLYLVINPALK